MISTDPNRLDLSLSLLIATARFSYDFFLAPRFFELGLKLPMLSLKLPPLALPVGAPVLPVVEPYL